ncbi:MAG: hypothetical protein ABI180_05125 [Microcoleus sp.]
MLVCQRSGDRPHTLSNDNSFDEECWLTISRIRSESDLSGKVLIILAVELWSKNIFSRLIRLKNPRNHRDGFTNLHN